MVTKYEEYINEGFYDWMNKQDRDDELGGGILAAFAGSVLWLAKLEAETETWKMIWLFIIIIAYLPATLFITRFILRDIYNNIRGALLVGTSAKKYKQLKAFLEKYPDLKAPLVNLKIRMNTAIKNNDRKEVSAILHELYKIKKNINKREKAGDFFILNDEEKEIFNKKENNLNGIDPFREEQWNEK
jgi:hypothetical protein